MLTPCYNEISYLRNHFTDNLNYVDNIIFLDDGSDDGSWELVKNNNKFGIKIKKKRDNSFNDLKNRNILFSVLKILKNNDFKIKWILNVDCDECLDSNNIDLIRKKIIFNNFDILAVPFYHMWDKDKFIYNWCLNFNISNNSDTSKYKTLNYYKRLINFKSIDEFRINSKKKLHFSPIPIMKEHTKVGLIGLKIKHLSTNTREKRFEKYNKYKFYDLDEDQHSYEHIINKNPILIDYDKIKLID